MKMILTGARGFLGARILEYYEGKHQFVCLTHQQIEEGGLKALEEIWEREKPDVLFHTAAISDTKRTEEEPEISWHANVEIPVMLAEACQKFGTKMVFCSSDQIYFHKTKSYQPEHYHTEEEEVLPKGLYGRQKLRAEQMILEKDPQAVCLRLSWMYDKVQRPGEHGTLLSTVLANIRNGIPMQYPIHDYRSITNVWEVVSNLEKASRLPGGVYNFGSYGTVSTYELVREILQCLNGDPKLLKKNEEAFADNPRNIKMDLGKTESCGICFSTTREGLLDQSGYKVL